MDRRVERRLRCVAMEDDLAGPGLGHGDERGVGRIDRIPKHDALPRRGTQRQVRIPGEMDGIRLG